MKFCELFADRSYSYNTVIWLYRYESRRAERYAIGLDCIKAGE